MLSNTEFIDFSLCLRRDNEPLVSSLENTRSDDSIVVSTVCNSKSIFFLTHVAKHKRMEYPLFVKNNPFIYGTHFFMYSYRCFDLLCCGEGILRIILTIISPTQSYDCDG